LTVVPETFDPGRVVRVQGRYSAVPDVEVAVPQVGWLEHWEDFCEAVAMVPGVFERADGPAGPCGLDVVAVSDTGNVDSGGAVVC
jgi:hypothetical protein